MSMLSLARADLRGFRAYSSARLEAGNQGVLLNANEWPWAPFDGGEGLNRYPAPQPPELLATLSELYGWPAEGILAGRGSDETIDLLARGFCAAGEDTVLICPPTFGMYRICAQLQGARVIEVPLLADQGFALDSEAVLAAVVQQRPKLVFLCSPNNPTGQQVDRDQLLALIDAIGERALVVVDEAYVEFADGASLIDALASRPQLLLLRTLSKAYGLAAVRLGVLLGSAELVAFLRALMAPY
ncbi:MAG: aminotransferase class I/II-fold pyridoxal phosphate-dependent enzyme, partial [Xanthomonadales bacterium]|nr:aminotransferase class I/II-fold pyridoxal phosphate-dependent enzyme [Xanthomonadales bacterium]